MNSPFVLSDYDEKVKIHPAIPCSTKLFRRRNKRKSVLEITKLYYFKI